ncbi:DHA2 family multidrug resistance protein [Phyllobacterium endophyticum]|nr:DHA2 family efflux MFS transporter permease subunit [Phyllobacterium endophyticum]MBB3237542.1 DHA2 family multidrug resistance protein [Phyllobacterium endophyticum]
MTRGPDADEAQPSRSTWLSFFAMCIGMFMAILDVQIVATSLPTIQGALNINPDQMSWIQTAYLIAEIIAIPLTGFLTRLLSMRRLFAYGALLFTAASVGCAQSESFNALLLWRAIQGFSGGTLIPTVFSAVFLLFTPRHQNVATTVAGVVAVMAPTVGPIVGGWITETYSWHWLFLINVAPGLLAAALAACLLPRQTFELKHFRSIDFRSLAMMATGLAALEIALKEAPQRGWSSSVVLSLCAFSMITLTAFTLRTWYSLTPLVDLHNFKDRNFALGCILSFVLGFGLFGSVYLMPVFLAYVRGRNALQIGETMLVTGMAQLMIAPLAVMLEQRLDARLLSTIGFLSFAIGLGSSSLQIPQTDAAGMFWPQVVRGMAIMICLLPPTRLALGNIQDERIPDASGLFNLMRNIGGAIGLALVDSVIYTRSATHGVAIVNGLLAGDARTQAFVGMAPGAAADMSGKIDLIAQTIFNPMIVKAALVQGINDAWAVLALITLVPLLLIMLAYPIQPKARL